MHNPTCFANHLGLYCCEPLWLQQAVASIRDGIWRPTPRSTVSVGGWDTTYIVHADGVEVDSATAHRPERVALYETTPEGVALISMAGPMMKGESKYGGVSTIQIRRAIRAADADERVGAIMLLIDSPGGHVAGTQELADEVRAARKPIYAHGEDLLASAAYWISSAADRVTANATAEVGSIGTVAVVEDTSGLKEARGVTVHVVSTGAYKGAFVDGAPVEEAHLRDLRERVERLNQFFLGAIETGRGLRGKRLEAVSDGRVFGAAQAVDLGLIDAVSSTDEAVAAVAAEVAQAREKAARRRSARAEISRAELRARLRRRI